MGLVSAEGPFNLFRHLRRLVRVSVEATRIVKALPPSPADAASGSQDRVRVGWGVGREPGAVGGVLAHDSLEVAHGWNLRGEAEVVGG